MTWDCKTKLFYGSIDLDSDARDDLSNRASGVAGTTDNFCNFTHSGESTCQGQKRKSGNSLEPRTGQKLARY